MLSDFIFIEIVLLCGMTKSIYVYNAGNPDENFESSTLNTGQEYIINAEKYVYPSSSLSEKYVYPYGSVDKDYGIINMSLLGLQNPSYTTDPTRSSKKKQTKNRVGFYNVQTGDEFFLNDFDVRPKFKTKQHNKHVIGYEYTPSQASKRKDQVQAQVWFII